MCNSMNSVKNLVENYEELKQLIMKKVSWNGIKETSGNGFMIGVACMKLADNLMEAVVQQDQMLREMSKKLDQLETLLRDIDSKMERPE